MKVLIAEDDIRTLTPYRIALEAKGHTVITADNGEDCINFYKQALTNTNEEASYQSDKTRSLSSDGTKITGAIDNQYSCFFDVVVLDYRMPKKDGMEVAKEILSINPNQRIIFASAYVKDTLQFAVKELKMVVELMQKPFKVQALVDTIEDIEIYSELKKLQVNAEIFKAVNPTHGQLNNLLESVKAIQKNRTF
jgi:CheY-like chemotaxis protein